METFGRTPSRARLVALQKVLLACCMDGHGVSPKEQKTQQSPGFGFSTVPQPVHG